MLERKESWRSIQGYVATPRLGDKRIEVMAEPSGGSLPSFQELIAKATPLALGVNLHSFTNRFPPLERAAY